MSEEIIRGDMSLQASNLVPENVHRVKPADADDSRNAREQFREAQEEQKDNDSAEREAQGEGSSEESVLSVHNWETIHDDIILSEVAQRLMDQSKPAEPTEQTPCKTDEKSPEAPVSRIHLTA